MNIQRPFRILRFAFEYQVCKIFIPSLVEEDRSSGGRGTGCGGVVVAVCGAGVFLWGAVLWSLVQKKERGGIGWKRK